jgi:hypothetical protein
MLAGGMMGLLAMGAAAGPVGIFFAAFIGFAAGFGLSALSSAVKDSKKDAS